MRPQSMETLRDSIAVRVKDYELIVISPYYISGVTLIKEDEPKGIYKAVEEGLKIAKGEYILHMPDDIHPTLGCVEVMEEFVGDKFAVGNFRFKREKPVPIHAYYGKPYSWCPFISRKSLDKLGGVLMDTHFTSFYGDPDLSLRMLKAGGEVLTCENAWMQMVGVADEIKKQSLEKYEQEDRRKFIERWGDFG